MMSGSAHVMPTQQSEIYQLLLAFQAQAAGAEVMLHASPKHDMLFASAADFFDVFMHAGPMQTRLKAYGSEHVAAGRQRFLEGSMTTAPFIIAPNAGLLVVRHRLAAL